MFLSKIKNAVTLLCCSLFALGPTAFVHAQQKAVQDAVQDRTQTEEKTSEKESSNIKNKKKKQNSNSNAQKKPSNERFIPSEEISEDSPIAFPVDI